MSKMMINNEAILLLPVIKKAMACNSASTKQFDLTEGCGVSPENYKKITMR